MKAVGDMRKVALDRVLASRAFANRLRLREFLSYVCEETLAGRDAMVKEQSIALAVFHKDGSGAGDDNVVRVTARHVRAKLEEYYLTEGAADPVQIRIPRGTYVPTFTEIEPASTQEQQLPLPAPVEKAPPAPSPVVRANPSNWVVWSGWIVAGLLTVALVFAGFWPPGLATVRATTTSPSSRTILGHLQPADGRRTLVVCADGAVQFIKAAYGSSISLLEYQEAGALRSRLPGWDRIPGAIEWVENSQMIQMSAVLAIEQLMRAFPPDALSLRHPRQITERDLVEDSAILLSGPFANPWVQMFEDKLNFRVTDAPGGKVAVRNTAPAAGEQAEYLPAQGSSGYIAYSRLALLPNLSGRGKVLLIGGPSTSLMEVLARSAASESFLHDLRTRLGLRPDEPLPHFEMLVEVREMSRAPVEVRVLAARIIRSL